MKIHEVSQKIALSQDTLRYYERIGLIPPVPRNASGIRDYDEDSLNWIEFVKCMRQAGLPIESLIEYVSLFHQGDQTLEARRLLLVEQRELLRKRIEEQQRTLTRLDHKIQLYEDGLMCERKMLQANHTE